MSCIILLKPVLIRKDLGPYVEIIFIVKNSKPSHLLEKYEALKAAQSFANLKFLSLSKFLCLVNKYNCERASIAVDLSEPLEYLRSTSVNSENSKRI